VGRPRSPAAGHPLPLVDQHVTLALAAHGEDVATEGALPGGPEAALTSLTPLLSDPVPGVREEVAAVFESLGDPRAAPNLARSLATEQDEGARARLRRALLALPKVSCARTLVATLGETNAADRLAAVVGLELIQAIEGVDGLVGAVRDADRRVALVAARALSAFRSTRTGGLAAAVDQRANDIGRAAIAATDAELKRALRKLYFDIRGRLPEQDLPR
jgi:HEAT repeat protein